MSFLLRLDFIRLPCGTPVGAWASIDGRLIGFFWRPAFPANCKN